MNEIVEAAVAVIQSDECVLLLLRSPEDRSYPGTWCLPGGRVDPGESARQAMVREVHEETGLRVRPVAHLGRFDSPRPERRRLYRIDVFRAELSGIEQALIDYPSQEHTEARWVHPAKALAELTLSGTVTRLVLRGLMGA